MEELGERIRGVFKNESGYKMALNYLQGLMSPAERKNGWQIAEWLGKETPCALQQFLYRGRFSAEKLRDELRSYVSDKLGEAEGVLVIDDTGFLKQGNKSCGVKRQYTGTTGKVTNCQVGVFLTYASGKGHTPIDKAVSAGRMVRGYGTTSRGWSAGRCKIPDKATDGVGDDTNGDGSRCVIHMGKLETVHMEITIQCVSGWKNMEKVMCCVYQGKNTYGKVSSKSV